MSEDEKKISRAGGESVGCHPFNHVRPRSTACVYQYLLCSVLLACISPYLAFLHGWGFLVGKKSAQNYHVRVERAIREKDKKTISYYSMVGYVFRSVPQFFISPVASILFIAYFFPFPLILFGISTTAVSLFTGIFYYALEKAKNISEEIENAMRRPRAPEVEEINT